jgi:hypothetical protein
VVFFALKMKKVTKIDKVRCCICNGYIKPMKDSKGKIVWDQGYNAYPIKKGRCCSACDKNLVMPARLKQ